MVDDLDNSIIFYDNRFLTDIRFVDILPEIQSKREELFRKYGVEHIYSLFKNNEKAKELDKELKEENGFALKLKY